MLEFMLLTGSLPLPGDLLLSPHSFLTVLVLYFFIFFITGTHREEIQLLLSQPRLGVSLVTRL